MTRSITGIIPLDAPWPDGSVIAPDAFVNVDLLNQGALVYWGTDMTAENIIGRVDSAEHDRAKRVVTVKVTLDEKQYDLLNGPGRDVALDILGATINGARKLEMKAAVDDHSYIGDLPQNKTQVQYTHVLIHNLQMNPEGQ
jgi:hypothetical protein